LISRAKCKKRKAVAMDIDRHFRRAGIKRYALQCGLAGVVLFTLIGLSIIKQLVLPALLDLI
jgi:hypothetical protein